MTKSQLSYKGFSGSSETSFEDNCLYGRILFINDSIIYEGNTPTELQEAFKAAVDRYLAYCKSTGKDADKPYSGSFNIRIGSELHKKAVIAASSHDMTLNEYVCMAIRNCVEHNGIGKVQHTHIHVISQNPESISSRLVTTNKPSKWEPMNVQRH